MEIRILQVHDNGYITVEVTGDIEAVFDLGQFALPVEDEEAEELRLEPEKVLAFRFLQRGETIDKIAVKVGASHDEVSEAVGRYLTRLGG